MEPVNRPRTLDWYLLVGLVIMPLSLGLGLAAGAHDEGDRLWFLWLLLSLLAAPGSWVLHRVRRTRRRKQVLGVR